MTVNQALTASHFCAIIYSSKQLTFGLANRFAQNAKIYNKLMEEVTEIKNRGNEREENEEAIMQELINFGDSKFEGSFKEIDLKTVESLNYEEFNISDNVLVLSNMLLALQELEIIK